MHIGPRTRLLLEFIVSTGIDILIFSSRPTRGLIGIGSQDDDYSLRRQLDRMAANGLIEAEQTAERSRWVIRLTGAGAAAVTDDIDPPTAWAREWDGEWRLIVFDLPRRARAPRQQLEQWLRRKRFGGLQGSAWITPHFPEAWNAEIADLPVKPSDVSFFQGKSFGRSSDRAFVEEAWSFSNINSHYQTLLDFHRRRPAVPEQEWLQTETALWRAAFTIDPFLPDPLLPPSYLGKQAFSVRRKAYALLSRQLADPA